MTKRKFAVFDIDGTLYRWQLYHELVETLSRDGVYPTQVYYDLTKRWNKWRGGEMSFTDYEHFVVSTMMEYLPAVPIELFDAACDKVVAQSGHKIHFYPLDLLKKLKQEGFCVIAITGSQQELIDRFGAHYGFDVVVGAQYERKNGRFTGKLSLATFGRKPDILREIVAKHDLSWSDSLAIGDSDGDAAILELVERPIAFNPSEGLFERAKQDGWPIVIERKNLALRLEKRNDELILADTIAF